MKQLVSWIAGLSYVLAALTFAGPAGARTAARRGHHGSASGQQVYSRNCARCHGASGQGKNGPKLAGRSLGAGAIAEKVTNGGSKMPSFKKRLSPGEIKAVAVYVQSLGGKS